MRERSLDEESREIAARLRELKPWGRYSSSCLMCEALSIDDMCPKDCDPEKRMFEVAHILADLIEPRPENTCHYTAFGDYEGDTRYVKVWHLSCGHDAINDAPYPPNYCPQCRAMVVYEADGECIGSRRPSTGRAHSKTASEFMEAVCDIVNPSVDLSPKGVLDVIRELVSKYEKEE